MTCRADGQHGSLGRAAPTRPAASGGAVSPLPLGEPELAARLRLVLNRLARRLRNQTPEDLSPSLTSALVTIELQGPITLGRLAACERVTPPSITRMVATLERLGLVRREADPADRRVARVSLTPEGRAHRAAHPDPQDGVPGEAASQARRVRARHRAPALPVLERLLEDDQLSDVPATTGGDTRAPRFVTRMFRSLRTRNYRLWFFGQTISQTRHLDAVDGAGLARLQGAHPQRLRSGHHDGAAVPARARLRHDRRPGGRPLRQAQGAARRRRPPSPCRPRCSGWSWPAAPRVCGWSGRSPLSTASSTWSTIRRARVSPSRWPGPTTWPTRSA